MRIASGPSCRHQCIQAPRIGAVHGLTVGTCSHGLKNSRSQATTLLFTHLWCLGCCDTFSTPGNESASSVCVRLTTDQGESPGQGGCVFCVPYVLPVSPWTKSTVKAPLPFAVDVLPWSNVFPAHPRCGFWSQHTLWGKNTLIWLLVQAVKWLGCPWHVRSPGAPCRLREAVGSLAGPQPCEAEGAASSVWGSGEMM